MSRLELPSRIAVSLLLALAAGCGPGESGKASGKGAAAAASSAAGAGSSRPPGHMRYARGFSLDFKNGATIITVHRPWQGARGDFAYRLVPRTGAAGAPAASDTQEIPVPVRRAATLMTTDLPHLEWLGALDALVGVGGGRYACSPAVRARLADGRIREVGEEAHPDLEALVALRPEAVFAYVVGGAPAGALAKLAEAGLPAVVDGSYMEETPLGRAEWIKFTAAFFGKEARADSLFASIDSAYRALASLAAGAGRRPRVVAGSPFGGVWWAPGGRSYVARLLSDAGADYAWAGDTTRGSLNLDLEAVLAKAGDAEIWLNADWKDLAEARARDPRFALFRAFREGRVWNNDRAECAGGGRDFYETGAARPDLVLADLIAILHPELLPGHALRWYRRLPAGGAEAAAR
jgi:iron complex transport system substrate-binding protein